MAGFTGRVHQLDCDKLGCLINLTTQTLQDQQCLCPYIQ